MKLVVAAILALAALAYAGDVVDLGSTEKVPNWAIGPLLTLPLDKVKDGRLEAERKETKRIGTIQENYAEIEGNRFTFESIHLWEVPNDGYSCEITTKPKGNHYYKIQLSQSLFDQTFYYVYLQRFEVGIEKAIEQNQYVVWDIKSRK
jgi:hypothetical protein